jgi:Na+/phosphate symporter
MRGRAGGFLRWLNWRKAGLFLASLVLFVLAIGLMKSGARGLVPLIRDLFHVSNPLNALGFGWLFAYLVLSGSPVAAAALAFYDVGALDQPGTFAMITGSRLGASLIVLFIGALYALRGHERGKSLTMGLLSLTVTGSTYLPALVIGYLMLSNGLFHAAHVETNAHHASLLDILLAPLIRVSTRLLSEWGVFVLGLAVIVVSFNLFDRALPEVTLKDSALTGIPRLLYRPLVMFVAGLTLTAISMSVSISLGMLVPLSARGYIRRENVIPYIMGANISTFVDTLLAGVLLGNPGAQAVVLAQMLSIGVISLLILILLLRPYERILLRFVERLSTDTRSLVVFLAVILLVPIVLLFVGPK